MVGKRISAMTCFVSSLTLDLNLINQSLCSGGGRIVQLPMGGGMVRGVTSLDDELFVLLDRDADQVAVYSINDYQLLRHINVPGFKPNSFSDITLCVRYKHLCISDSCNRCIQACNLNTGATSQWCVPGEPHGLSETPCGNLLVTCWCLYTHLNKLVEVSVESGTFVREIPIPLDIKGPCHAVQLRNGQHVMCHSSFATHVQRICVMNNDGSITSNYRLCQRISPSHLVVDELSQHIYVADCFMDRIVVMTPTLEFVHDICDVSLNLPYRLHLSPTTQRLYVCQHSSVAIIHLQL